MAGGDDISVEDDHHIPEEEEELENEEEEEDEEAWLDALETGNVDERGYIPQKKDPTSMTARQVCVCVYIYYIYATYMCCIESNFRIKRSRAARITINE